MKILFIILILFILPIASFAISSTPEDSYIYLFHLYFDNGQLFADRDYEIKYDIVAETFVPETLTTQFPYKGEIINLKGEVAVTFLFDPKQGDPNFKKGKISVKAPYFPDGQKVIFYNNQNQVLLTIFVNESSFCNDDGVCNPDVGEDTKTCPSDCKTATPVPIASPEPTAGNSGLLKSIVYIIIGLGLAGGWFGWKWWQKRQASLPVEFTPANLPPSPPLTL